MEDGARGVMVFTASVAAFDGQVGQQAYSASKAAMEAIVRAWADEVEHTRLRAAIIDPGAMRTRMRAEAYPGEDPADLPDPSEIGPMMIELALSDPGLPTSVRTFRAWKADRAALTPST
jgi:NAD(P)-dependent dehydrogenase (short-subunit alcohol dehydrogenase family)